MVHKRPERKQHPKIIDHIQTIPASTKALKYKAEEAPIGALTYFVEDECTRAMPAHVDLQK